MTGWRIGDAARASVADPALTRPDWVAAARRDTSLLWLDKNENTDPELQSVTARVVAEVLSGEGARYLSTYPESARLYRKLAAHVGCDPSNLTLTAGSDGGIRAVFEAFVNPGDVVLHTSPTFAMYPVYCQMYGAKPVTLGYVRTAEGPKLEVERVLAAVAGSRAKLLCLPNPDSPTGTVFSPEDLRSIVSACSTQGTVCLIDEAYHPFHPETAAGWVRENPHLIVARTFAKAWGLAGLRVGYTVAHPDASALLHKVRPMYEVNTVAVAVLERMLDFVPEVQASVRRLNEGRDGFLGAMESLALPTVRARGNFLHVAFGAGEPAVYRALESIVLYRRDGFEDCLRGYSRFSASTTAVLAPVIARITAVVNGARAGGR